MHGSFFIFLKKTAWLALLFKNIYIYIFLIYVYMCLSTVPVHTERHYQYCLFASLLQLASYLENNHKGQSNSQHSPEFFGDLIRSS